MRAQEIDPAAQPGVDGNSRLTAVNGVLLLVLLAVGRLPILSVRHC